MLLRLKSVFHNPLKPVRGPREDQSSFLRTYSFRVILFLIPCTLYLISVLLPVANAATATIAWSPNDEPDLEGYVIYRNTNSPGPPYSYSDALPEDELDDPLHPKVKLTGLLEGREYYIALTAYNTEGVESSFSNEVCATVVNNTIEPCETIASSLVTTSSSGSSGSGGSSLFSCFISTASNNPSDKNLLLYILFTITAIILITTGYKKKF